MQRSSTQHSGQRPNRLFQRAAAGFTLIEVMIVVAIIGILASLGYPAYTDYVLRGRIVPATNQLAAWRAQMEQYYQDNRTYLDVSVTIKSPCNSTLLPTATSDWTYACPTWTANTYTLRATGNTSRPVAGFVYSVNEQATQSYTVGTVWGGGSSSGCWQTRRGESC